MGYPKKRRRTSGGKHGSKIGSLIAGVLVAFAVVSLATSLLSGVPKAMENPGINLEMDSFTGGSVVAGKETYKTGDTVSLIVAPTECYSQKLYLNDQPILLGWKTNSYEFVADEDAYKVSGSFVESLNMTYDADRWSTVNQAHGILNAYYITEDSSWLAVNGDYHTASVMVKNYLAGDGSGGEGFAVSLGLSFSNGKTYTYRVIKEGGSYYCQRFNMGGSWQKFALTDDIVAAICGDGAKFTVERVGPNQIAVFVNEVNFDTYTMGDVGEGNAVTKVNIGHYGNKNIHIALPFEVLAGE